MKTIAQSYLTCVDGAHNKHYLAELVEDGGTYRVPCRYGAIGAKLSSTIKYQGPSHNLAMAAFTKVVGEKRAKGYADAPVPASLVATGANVIPADSLGREASTGVPRFAAQLAAADGGAGAIASAVERPDHHRVEEKWDGWRALIVFAPDGTLSIRNRSGEDKGRIANTPLLEAALRTLGDTVPALWDGTVIDGELVGPTFAETATLLSAGGRSSTELRFVAFDLPYFAGVDRRGAPLRDRLHDLELVLRDAVPPIEASTALIADTDLADAIWASGGEGLIIKDLAAPYASGGRTGWWKLKRVQTEDAVVIGLEPGKGRYAGQTGALILGQHDAAGTLVEIARVSGMRDDERRRIDARVVGQVVEFDYQERTAAGRFRHPRFKRFRPDRDPVSCRVGA
jgi:ATP-dependent DNA ligase/predicted DNA-binding WGR domain protein